ncbi:MAG: hypothetical protein C0469_05205 [Cyanobacteria bacterium DS2.3.42]|nr:hypothetical protein [Cyanobacteria bacterium DS2.3.42]
MVTSRKLSLTGLKLRSAAVPIGGLADADVDADVGADAEADAAADAAASSLALATSGGFSVT